MLIFPWSKLHAASYIKLSNLKIDGKNYDEELRPDLSYKAWIHDTGEPVKATGKITLYPRNEFDLKDFKLIETDVIVGILMAGLDYQNPEKYKFYKENIDFFNELSGANLIIHSAHSMLRTSYPLDIVDINKLSDEDLDIRDGVEEDLLFKATIEIPKDYFGLDFTINPSFELPTSTEENKVLGVYSGGEPKYSDSILRINFNETEPIIKNAQKIEIKKIYFDTGEPYNKQEGDENIDIEKSLKNEEWWVSTEVDDGNRPYGYVNIDIDAIKELLDETTEDTNKDWFFYFKRLKQDEITNTVWKVVMHTILVKVFKTISDESAELHDISQEEIAIIAYEHLSEFEKAALGFFSKKILAIGRATDSSENASLEVIKEIMENGPERNLTLMNLEIEKFIDIKKSTELVWEAKIKQDIEEDDESDSDGRVW